MNNADREAYREKIFIGEKVKELLGKDIAKYLSRKSDEDVDAAFQRFLFLDPHDVKTVSECQIAARSALGAIEWLREAIAEGNKAFDEYMQLEELKKTKTEGTL